MTVAAALVVAVALIGWYAGRTDSRQAPREGGSVRSRVRAPAETVSAETSPAAPAPEPYAWARENRYIAHGMGRVGGLSVTNTRDAFLHNYELGHRVFEVDLIGTRDGALVARHDWSQERFSRFDQDRPASGVPSLREFRASKVAGKYEPLSAAGVIKLMEDHPDAYVMTDMKLDGVKTRAAALKKMLDGADESVRARLIVQIYEEGDLRPTRKLGIDNIVYTFYRLTTSRDRALSFAEKNGIGVITIPRYMAEPALVAEIRRSGMVCAVHTINDAGEARRLRERGVDLLYTDNLKP